GLADAGCDLRITDRLAGRYFTKRPPYPFLERGALDVQRQVQAERGCFYEADDLRHKLLKVTIAADQRGVAELVLQVPRQLVGILAEQDGADAALALRDEDGAERALPDCKADLHVGAAGAEVARSHAQHAVRGGVEPAVGV